METVEPTKKPQSQPEELQQSTLCKYFGNAFIKSLHDNHVINSQKIYYLSMMMGCGNYKK